MNDRVVSEALHPSGSRDHPEVAGWARPHPSWRMWRPMSVPAAMEPSPVVIESAQGMYLTDVTGRRMLDMCASLGYVNVGYDCAEIRDAISRQMARLPTFSSHGAWSHPVALELAERLVVLSEPEHMARVLFSNGGSDAVETALKLARQYWRLCGHPGKREFVSFKLSYHGVGMGGMSVSGLPAMQAPYGPGISGCHQILPPLQYHYPGRPDEDALTASIVEQLESTLCVVGAENIAAFVAEPIQCAAGVIVPPARLWSEMRAVCDRHDVLLIADEVVTGFGRTGDWFGARTWRTRPDIVCCAKGINSGYVPLGATLVGSRVASAWDDDRDAAAIVHGYTYSGHPLACAAALANLAVIERDRLIDNARDTGRYLLNRADALRTDPLVGDVRGCGLMLAIEFVVDPNTRLPLDYGSPTLRAVRESLEAQGIVVRWAGNQIIMTPPLIVERRHVDLAIDAIGTALADAPRPNM